ncbi:hypothetical protein [Bifidobacterium cuniculi]|uniref:Uncharacterized protein n=1 Tax=Bifidobacterium cuniculi TaxID=1688 RepID=A0A087B4X8_9BIFI|nr:hypothetical protein [Bifidobacterium cuniculi]KFI66078.1 hypothetical protein BCUN_0580 [Bifidobacterium cuniculi]
MAGVYIGLLLGTVGGFILLYVIIRVAVRDGQRDVIRSNKVAQTEKDKKAGDLTPYVVAIVAFVFVGAICVGVGLSSESKKDDSSYKYNYYSSYSAPAQITD